MFSVLFKIGERIPGRRNSRCTGPETGDACGPSRKCKHVGTNGSGMEGEEGEGPVRAANGGGGHSLGPAGQSLQTSIRISS